MSSGISEVVPGDRRVERCHTVAMTAADLIRRWPAAGVRARARDLELRWLDDDLLVTLGDLAARGVHDPGRMPFAVPWTRGDTDTVVRRLLSYQWHARSQIAPERFMLELGVLVDGILVGVQGASADDWGMRHRAETGSWLGIEYQGRRIGTRMRALMLFALFDGLGAREVTSGAFADNAASNAISRRVGYRPHGTTMVVRENAATPHHNYSMTRDRFEAVREQNLALLGGAVTLDGFDTLRLMLIP